jgi:KDO2-lipid IV(A) lauroyltransferase
MAKRRRHPLQQRLEYLAYRALSAVARRMSDPAAQRWGARIGNLARRILKGRDALAVRNLRETFPEKSDAERRAILDESWRHFGRELLIFLRVQSMSLEEIAERCPAYNTELFDEAVARGNGVLVVSGHFGSWEVAALAMLARFPHVTSVARALDNEFLEKDLSALRARTGAQLVDRRSAARPLMKALQNKGVVCLLIDQAVQPREGVLVPFLGRPAWTTDAPAKLALRYGSTIVFTSCIPDGTRHRLEFERAIAVNQLSEEERNVVALTGRINQLLSDRIASRPELWLWMHDRWKGTATAHGE